MKESNWWLGVNYLYINAENTFRDADEQMQEELPEPSFEFNQAGLGAFVEYDGRNTTFTPTQGLRALLEYRNYGDTWGSDFDYDHYLGSIFHYTPFGDYSSLGLRLEGESVDGDVPFFGYPYINLRGMPALRYQGESTITAEAEYLWGVTPRWTLVFFGGEEVLPGYGKNDHHFGSRLMAAAMAASWRSTSTASPKNNPSAPPQTARLVAHGAGQLHDLGEGLADGAGDAGVEIVADASANVIGLEAGQVSHARIRPRSE